MVEQVQEPEITGVAAAFNMEEWPFYWLTRFTGRYLLQMELALKPLGLDIPRWRVLMTLRNRETMSVSEIADHAIVKLPTMTKIVKRMQADNLVDCRQSAADGRVTEVMLTPEGVIAGRKAWDAANRIYERAFEDLSKKDVSTLNKLLRTITRSLAG
ncbi:MarR family winged helix-turn-helix transcriptional regulator [Sphingobium sp. CAP-1]|uniref:MarR family winged helix-turn-helix transcriptional regulator n=1 Tax=Sphingobium sp. CAP-1 TaxID=2676077 RepID=UPI0012BB355E|nr:MarR family transcriptional regulator [Sphingobium sp. CAP-1]QGP78050.1 MarR family transcriptional regulator [Sphingobium sp. CAP-1]